MTDEEHYRAIATAVDALNAASAAAERDGLQVRIEPMPPLNPMRGPCRKAAVYAKVSRVYGPHVSSAVSWTHA